MPELPEVETLCRQLDQVVTGEKILRIEILDSLLGKEPELSGRKFLSVKRRGKFIDLNLDGGLTATLHLRMTGRLLYLPEQVSPPFPAHSRLAIYFTKGTLLLIDPRRFGTFCVRPEEKAPALANDPLKGIPARTLWEISRKRQMPVKSFLMDQRAIAGIGNIYACEILFAAGIDPRRPASGVTLREWGKVKREAKVILSRAVECRGTTVSDWRDLFGKSGKNQENLEVYSREGAACNRCDGKIERIKLGGRGTWFCPNCQK
ncbi:MAG: bifunctional DNA-formamidopyrimidine glycosylase/DNA-(apurinic or apyrimidinic site) lyase [Syntrophales bacterium]|jgi:formamidopyrimidine-DNA glycosylase|nr:bifunctional DNA-formamidopyrimidine glycosylase/DNA-(apurinic or apyrimidinic site) lyase [Syntrophales bacterium]